LIKKEQIKNTRLFGVDTIEKSYNTIDKIRGCFIIEEKRVRKQVFSHLIQLKSSRILLGIGEIHL